MIHRYVSPLQDIDELKVDLRKEHKREIIINKVVPYMGKMDVEYTFGANVSQRLESSAVNRNCVGSSPTVGVKQIEPLLKRRQQTLW